MSNINQDRVHVEAGGNAATLETRDEKLPYKEFGDVPNRELYRLGRSGIVKAVHKKDEEGFLEIDGVTGVVIRDPEDADTPAWAAGLACAILPERTRFWTQSFGPELPEELKDPKMFAFEDLSWVGVNDAGDELVIDADIEFRSELKTILLGQYVDEEGRSRDGLPHLDVDMAADQTRTPEEVAELEKSQATGFGAVTGTHGG